METKRLVPYSVHLPQDIYAKLKIAAGNRKASVLVRDAITMIIEGDDVFNSGYNKGIRDAISVINEDGNANNIAIGGYLISDSLVEQLDQMVIIIPKAKNGKEK
jgi:hypothetical protein